MNRCLVGSNPRVGVRCLALPALLALAAQAGAGSIQGPYLQEARTDSMTVCWATSTESRGTVEYRETDRGERFRRVGERRNTRYHRVRLAGLRPYTRYEYRVECSGQRREGSFRTAPLPSQPFHFAVYGDTRTQADQHARVVRSIQRFHPDFAIQTGDLVENGTAEAQWSTFFAVAAPLLQDAPYYPALGNHELGGAPYFRYFAVPREYSFDYGNAHFMVLDSNRPREEDALQESWLREELAAGAKSTWRIVALHHTLYISSTSPRRRRESAALRARLEPILQAGGVALVLSGHAHNYQHHFASGIHYVVTGGGGAPLIDLGAKTPTLVAARKAHHHCEVTIRGRRLWIRAVEPDGTTIEKFEVQARR